MANININLQNAYAAWREVLNSAADLDGIHSEAFRIFCEDIIPCDITEEKGVKYLYVLCKSDKVFKMIEVDELSSIYMYKPLFMMIKMRGFTLKYKVCKTEPEFISYPSEIFIEMRKLLLKYKQYMKAQKDAEILYENIKANRGLGVDSIISKDESFKQSNKLTRAKFQKLTLTQKKVLNYLIWKFQHSEDKNDITGQTNNTFTVTRSELSSNGCGANSSQIFRNLTKIGKETWMMIKDEKGAYLSLPMFTKFQESQDHSVITIELSEVLVSLINKLAIYTEYTILNKRAINSVNSYYSMRMYELCCQYRNSDKYVFYITDEELRGILQCTESYLKPKDFKQKVLQLAERELKELAKSGKVDVYFTFAENEKRKKDWDYGQKEVVSWVFFVHKDIAQEAYVPTDQPKEKREFSRASIENYILLNVNNVENRKRFIGLVDKLWNSPNPNEIVKFANKLQSIIYITIEDDKEKLITSYFETYFLSKSKGNAQDVEFEEV